MRISYLLKHFKIKYIELRSYVTPEAVKLNLKYFIHLLLIRIYETIINMGMKSIDADF